MVFIEENETIFLDNESATLITYSHCIYWFNYYSRDERSLCVVCGMSVLLKFGNLGELEKCIQVAYLEYRDIQRLYFQI